MKDIFKQFNGKEDHFWKLVKLANWPKDGYEKAKIRYLKTLSKYQCSDFRAFVNVAFNALDNSLSTQVDEISCGDDSYSDLLHHIIGLGKEEFYRNLKNRNLVQKRADDSDYKESFSYAIPYDHDYGPNSEYNIDSVIKSAKKDVASLKKYLKLDNDKDRPWLNKLNGSMPYVIKIFTDFLNNPTEKGLKELVSNKKVVYNFCKCLGEFLDYNEMELPLKFTIDVDFINGIHYTLDIADSTLEYLSGVEK